MTPTFKILTQAVTFMPTTVDAQHWAFFLLMLLGALAWVLLAWWVTNGVLGLRAMRQADTPEPIRRLALEALTEFPRPVRR